MAVKGNDARHEAGYAYGHLRKTVWPMVLMTVCPVVILLANAAQRADEWSIDALLRVLPWPRMDVFVAVILFAVWQALMIKYLPGEKFTGPRSPKGQRQTYTLNGVPAFLITHAVFMGGTWLGLWNGGIIIDRFPDLLGTLSLFAPLFCMLLYVAGRLRPTCADCEPSGNILNQQVFDYYWGVELYPRWWDIPLKQLTNCRFGMQLWGLIVVSCYLKQKEVYGHVSNGLLVSTVLQMLYIFKFYLWEGGYFASLDIMHDKLGFYICFGCLVWITGIYTLASYYMTLYPSHISQPLALLFFLAGLLMLFINYNADLQRQLARKHNGDVIIWGTKAKVIHAKYVTEDGKAHSNILLASGWWGLSRHFHYVPEVLLSVCWCLPGFAPIPMFYPVYLTLLLWERLLRDDVRCSLKYGEYWKQYCKEVPYLVIPGIY